MKSPFSNIRILKPNLDCKLGKHIWTKVIDQRNNRLPDRCEICWKERKPGYE